jgi:hypothetical protein
MDPDAALDAAREALEALDARDERQRTWSNPELESLVESFRALDEWITKGGFLPAAWAATVGALPAL